MTVIASLIIRTRNFCDQIEFIHYKQIFLLTGKQHLALQSDRQCIRMNFCAAQSLLSENVNNVLLYRPLSRACSVHSKTCLQNVVTITVSMCAVVSNGSRKSFFRISIQFQHSGQLSSCHSLSTYAVIFLFRIYARKFAESLIAAVFIQMKLTVKL